MSIRIPALSAAVALAFGTATALAAELVGPGSISTGLQETTVAITSDGNTLYFMRSDFGETDDTILVSHRENGRWGTPAVASFSGQWHDSEPALSPDGKRLYFVSNRPVQAGGTAVRASMAGHEFTGKNLWYVQASGRGWGAPVHVDGAMNHGAMIYNPAVASSGNIYFSAHRADSGKAYQVYVVSPRAGGGYDDPRMVPLGDVANNRMDPAIDPKERFILYAGNEGDSLGRADIYIAFRQPDGRWGKPEHLPGDVNSKALENAPSLGPGFGELYVSSDRAGEITFPKKPDTAASLQARLEGPDNGSRNLWRVDIGPVLRAHGITD